VVSAWKEELLSSILEVGRGISYGIVQPGENRGNGIPIVRVNAVRDGQIDTSAPLRVAPEIESAYERTRLRGGELLLTLVGTVGEAAEVPLHLAGWNVARAIAVIPVRSEVGARWVRYILRTQKVRHLIDSWCNTTVQKTLNLKDVARIPVPLPPPATRQAILEVVGSLDDKIDMNRRMNQALELMAQALFRSWFVDFDPVRAKTEGRQPEGMDAETAALFPAAMDSSDGGLLPLGWRRVTLDSSIEILTGGTPRTAESSFWGGEIPWFSVKDAPADGDIWVVSTEKTITDSGLENCAAELLPVGTTIITARGTVGKLALTAVPMAMNQSCYGVRGRIQGTDAFTYYLLKNAVGDLRARTHGTVFETITRQTFSAIPVSLAPIEVRQRFDTVVEPMLKRVKANLLESKTLAELRDTLLPKLLSGEVRVGEAEAEWVASD